MAKITVLNIVQRVLEAIGHSPVQNVADTPSAKKVLRIAEEVFYQEQAYGDWPHNRFAGRLVSLGDTNRPTTLVIPEDITSLDEFKYQYVEGSGRIKFEELEQVADPRDFLDMVLARDSTESNVQVVKVPASEPVDIFVYNDRRPRFWTTFDDRYVVADSYNQEIETTLQGSKTVITGTREQRWSSLGDAYPPMPPAMFPYFLSRVTAVAAERLNEEAAASDREAEFRGRAYFRQQGRVTKQSPRKKKRGRT